MIRQETYKIEIVKKIDDDNIVRPTDGLMPVADHILSLEILEDLKYSFHHMARDLNCDIKITRHIHVWCNECRAYIGCKDIPFVEKKFNFRMSLEICDDPVSVERFLCNACGHHTSLVIQAAVYKAF